MAVTGGGVVKDTTAHTSRKLEDSQGLIDRRQLAAFQGNRPDGLGVGVCHLGDSRLLLHGLNHVPERLDALTHLGPGISAHNLLEEVVGKGRVSRQGGFALDHGGAGRLAVAPVVPVRAHMARRTGGRDGGRGRGRYGSRWCRRGRRKMRFELFQ